MKKEELSRQYAEKAVRENPDNKYKGYHLHRQMELTRFDGYDIQQAFEDGMDAASGTPAVVTIESEWFWGTSIHLITTDGHALVKLVIDKRTRWVCELYDLATHPSHRRRGYAAMLMRQAEETAREKGCVKAVLWVEKDSWQEQWYRRLGYAAEPFIEPVIDGTVWLGKVLF